MAEDVRLMETPWLACEGLQEFDASQAKLIIMTICFSYPMSKNDDSIVILLLHQQKLKMR